MRRIFSMSFVSKPASLALCALLATPAIMLPQDQSTTGSGTAPGNTTTTTTSKNAKKDTDAIGDRNVACKVNFYSIEKEIALGKGLAQEVERQSKIVNDPVIAEYVNRLGQNLVRNSDAKVPFTIKVIDGEEVNAFALPGGFFFVYSGLILKADSEAELAGVMAHEIAHVAARHGTCQATKGEIAQLSTIPLIFLGGWAGYGIRQGVSLLIPMGFLQFSRQFEKEADYLGLQYMYKAGYDPTAFVDFFEKIETLEKRKPGTMAKVFATHPMTEDRIVASQKEIAEILKAKPEYVVTTSEFNDVKGRLAAMHNVRKMNPSKDADPNKPTLRRNPNSTAPIEDETDPTTKSKGDDDERPTLKRRPTDTSGDTAPTTTSAPTTPNTATPAPPNN
jgi:beta-barrel assembly-enhancing protease